MKSNPLKILLIVDLLIAGAYGLILPIFPLFLMDTINGATLFTIALAQSIFLLSKINFHWIATNFIQHVNHVSRARGGLLTGTIIISLAPILYLLATDMTFILLIQIFLGLGMGVLQASWKILSHEDIKKTDWATLQTNHQHTAIFVMALTAALGGFTAYTYGYNALMFLMTSIGSLGVLMSLLLIIKSPVKKNFKKSTVNFYLILPRHSAIFL